MNISPVISRLLGKCAAAVLAVFLAMPAYAEDALSVIASRSHLSNFYNLLKATGSDTMLKGSGYTIFAPVNSAFDEYPAATYPYLFSPTPHTLPWATQIAHNHIVRGETSLDTVTGQKGGVFSVDNRLIPINQAHASSKSPWGNKGTFYVEGNRVLNMTMLGGGILYEIDGLIALPQELAEVVSVESPASHTTIVVPPDSNVTVEEEIAPGVTRSTTVTAP